MPSEQGTEMSEETVQAGEGCLVSLVRLEGRG